MKRLFRIVITELLSLLARIKIMRERPAIIGVTGSVGKTSTKDAIVHVLAQKFVVKAAKGGYNTEIGVPMMILNQQSKQDSSIKTWLGILWGGFCDMLKGEKMDIMVVEMGVDAPGDMRVLTRLIKPTIAVLTNIANVHVAPGQFGSEAQILAEKAAIAKHQSGSDIFITNNDNSWIAGHVHTNSKRIRYGADEANEYAISEVKGDTSGISFHLRGTDVDHDFHIPILGTYHVSVLVPAIIIALQYKITPEEIAERLRTFSMPKGRMQLLEGMHGARIIDSSYNASPTAMAHALTLIDSLSAPRKILGLGQMNELGTQSEAAHREIGRQAAKIGDLFILVGKDAAFYEEELLKGGVEAERIKYFLDSAQAGQFLKGILQEGDLVFAKGSQNGVRMENMIREILKEPERAAELLVRQGAEWK